MAAAAHDVRARARASLGQSSDVLYRRAASILRERGVAGRIVDVGCGQGRLRDALRDLPSAYVGVDVVRFDGFPADAEFRMADLDLEPLPLDDRTSDATIALETIEHLENPRRFMRELARVTRPGGIVLVSTPNQRSARSLAALLLRGQYAAFQDGEYPAHITALLDVDLRRMAQESGLSEVEIQYSKRGRIPLIAAAYPVLLARTFPRACSDHLFLVARVPPP
jgi:2-polyprenyl-3-methyl-5-hydroxy-6-metoxy-1,4-benzoquinol methylase